jgi:HK97 gp10 family phage protein
MTTVTTFEIEGLQELDEALAQFSKGVARGIARRALQAAAAPVAEAIRAAAPVDSGKLRDSIRVVVARAKGGAGGQAARKVYAAGGSAAQALDALINAGRQAKADGGSGTLAEVSVVTFAKGHAHLQEFGTQHHAANPFIRPGWEATKHRALETIKALLWQEIEKAAARAARKAARAAAAGAGP